MSNFEQQLMERLEDYALRIIVVYNLLPAYPSRGDAFTPNGRSGYRSNKLRCHAALTPNPLSQSGSGGFRRRPDALEDPSPRSG